MRMKDGLAYNLNNAPSTESTKKTQHKKYLTQPKLEKLLKEIQDFEWLGSEIKVPGYPKRKWDMKFKYNSNIFIVEYDGDEHYRNSLKIKVDHEKDKTARDLGYIVVRIPYWIQMDSEMLTHYFGINKEVKRNFQHGFITTRLFPASFCEKGIERFQNELDNLPKSVKEEVMQSLRAKIDKHGREYVLPQSLYGIEAFRKK